MKLHNEATEETAGIVAGISDLIRAGELEVRPDEVLGATVLRGEAHIGTERVHVSITVVTVPDAAAGWNEPLQVEEA